MEILRENKLFALIVLVLIGHLFWIKFEFSNLIVFLDNLERIVILALIWYIYKFETTQLKIWKFYFTWRNFFLIVLASSAVLLFAPINEILFLVLDPISSWRWHHFPPISNPFLKFYDLTIGLLLVAIAEELVYRKLFLDVMQQYKLGPLKIYLYSSVIFAILHLYQSVQLTFGAFVAGLMLMYVYKKTGTLWVPIVAHYLVNLYFFGVGIPFVSSVPS